MRNVAYVLLAFACFYESEVVVPSRTAHAEGSTAINDELNAESWKIVRSALADKDLISRVEAIRRLSKINAPQVAQLLEEQARNKIPTIRSYAAMSLGNRGDRAGISVLTSLLKDEDREVKLDAAKALSKIGGSNEMTLLESVLKEDNQQFRWAVWGIVVESKNKAILLMRNVLKNGDEYNRVEATFCLGNLGEPSEIPFLKEALQDVSSKVQFSAAVNLSRLGDSSGVGLLKKALENKDASAKQKAMEALFCLGDSEAQEITLRELANEDTKVRQNAVTALQRCNSSSADVLLRAALNDKSESIRIAAMGTIGERAKKDDIPWLKTALEDRSEWIRISAAEALLRLGDLPSPAILLEASKSKDFVVRESSVRALSRECGTASLQVFLKAIHDDEDSSIQLAAMQGLGRCNAKVAMPFLLEFLIKEDSSLIAEAAETLIKLGEGPRTFEPFLKADNALTRINAAVAILQLTEPATSPAE